MDSVNLEVIKWDAKIEPGSHYSIRNVDVFCIKNYVGTRGEDLSTVKCFKHPW